MVYELFLDDERDPPESSNKNYVICRSFEEAVEMFKSCPPSSMSLDHDLGDQQKTGLDFVKWMVEYDLDSNGTRIPQDLEFVVHSQNPPGGENIRTYLSNYLTFRRAG